MQVKGRCLNFGIGGHTTSDMPRDPDNQSNKRVELPQHEQNAREILSFFKARCWVLYVSQYPVQYKKNGLNPDIVAAYIQAGIRLAREQEISTLDIFAMIDDAQFQKYIYPDGMHFNPDGHAFIADQIWDFLEEHRMI